MEDSHQVRCSTLVPDATPIVVDTATQSQPDYVMASRYTGNSHTFTTDTLKLLTTSVQDMH
jgi:hypothetical protein